MDILGINIGTFEGAFATAIVMAVGWILQFKKYKKETNKIQEEANQLAVQNATLKAATDNEVIKGWKIQMESNNESISKLLSSVEAKDKQIEDLKDELVLAKDSLREAKAELSNARGEITRIRKVLERNGISIPEEGDIKPIVKRKRNG